jgi:DNA-binding NarL/FixJ family response regulator
MAKKAKRRGRPRRSKNKKTNGKLTKNVSKMDVGQLRSYITNLEQTLAAISEILLNQQKRGATEPPSVLTPREREVVKLIAEGNGNKMIGRALDISVKTVETHRAAAMRKLSLDSTAALVRYAIRNRLTPS